MLVQFTADQFSMLRAAFSISDPREAFTPEEMPVPVEALEELSEMLGTATDNTIALTPKLAKVMEACFVIGSEGARDDDPAGVNIDDESYYAILGLLDRAKAH